MSQDQSIEGQQIVLSESGELVELTSWDGEPLYCQETVQEGLFAAEAFSQLRGQLFMADEDQS